MPPHNHALAQRARRCAEALGVRLSVGDDTSDHLQVLRETAAAGTAEWTVAVNQVCSAGEVVAATASSVTAGVVDFLEGARDAGKSVVIVTNNAEVAAQRFCELHGLEELVVGIVGRDPHRIDHLKPHPAALLRALAMPGLSALERGMTSVVMIGDSPSDARAAAGVGIACIGVAVGDFGVVDLVAAGATVATDSMQHLAGWISTSLPTV